MSKSNMLISLFVLLAVTTGCQRRISPNHYGSASVGEASQTYRGVIVSARTVDVGPEELGDNAAGALIGGVGGGFLGSQIGGGTTSHIVGGVLGAGAGLLAGSFIEDKLMSQQGMEYVVQLDNGQLMTVVQGNDAVLGVGQRVLVMVSSGGRSRVVPDNSPAPAVGSRAAQVNAQHVVSQPTVVYNKGNRPVIGAV